MSYIKERERVDWQHPHSTTVCATVEDAVQADDMESYDFLKRDLLQSEKIILDVASAAVDSVNNFLE